jgi:hypothetical protein
MCCNLMAELDVGSFSESVDFHKNRKKEVIVTNMVYMPTITVWVKKQARLGSRGRYQHQATGVFADR